MAEDTGVDLLQTHGHFHGLQGAVVGEGIGADVDNRICQGEALNAGVIEGLSVDILHACGDLQALEADTVGKGMRVDIDNGVGDGDGFHTLAAHKQIGGDGGHALFQRDVLQRGAAVEGTVCCHADGGIFAADQGLGDGDGFQGRAMAEDTGVDLLQTHGHFHGLQGAVVGEGIGADVDNRICQGEALNAGVIEGLSVDVLHACGDLQALEVVAVGKGMRVDIDNGVGDGDGLQSITADKQIGGDGGHALFQDGASKADAAVEGAVCCHVDGGIIAFHQGLGDGDILQAGAVAEGCTAQISQILGQMNGLQIVATLEGAFSNGCYRIRNGDGAHGASIKGIGADGGDGVTVDGVGDIHHSTVAHIIGDADAPAAGFQFIAEDANGFAGGSQAVGTVSAGPAGAAEVGIIGGVVILLGAGTPGATEAAAGAAGGIPGAAANLLAVLIVSLGTQGAVGLVENILGKLNLVFPNAQIHAAVGTVLHIQIAEEIHASGGGTFKIGVQGGGGFVAYGCEEIAFDDGELRQTYLGNQRCMGIDFRTDMAAGGTEALNGADTAPGAFHAGAQIAFHHAADSAFDVKLRGKHHAAHAGDNGLAQIHRKLIAQHIGQRGGDTEGQLCITVEDHIGAVQADVVLDGGVIHLHADGELHALTDIDILVGFQVG